MPSESINHVVGEKHAKDF